MRLFATLIICLAVSLVACDSGSDSSGNKDATNTDDSCEPGTQFGASDGCNTCTCPESGKKSEASCTTLGCPEPENGCNGKQCGATCVTISDCPGVCNGKSKCVCEGTDLDCPGENQTQWYLGCGTPTCGPRDDDPNIGNCTDETEGAACSDEGSQCDPGDSCNAMLICASTDPKGNPDGCPKSRRSTKKDIKYLDMQGLKKVHSELMSMRLANWRYKNDLTNAKARLGFIIEDIEPSVAANSSRGHVDLYSFTSMAVAAAQHQNQEMAALKKEVAALKKMLKALKAKK